MTTAILNHALQYSFDPNIFIAAEGGKQFGALSPISWDRLSGTGADAPQVRGGGVFRPAQTVASLTSCGAASTVTGIPAAGGLFYFETGALGGSDGCQLQVGLHLGVPATGIVAPSHGFYITASGVQHTITPSSGGGVANNCLVGVQNPTLGVRVALVRWDDTRLSWFRQAGTDSARMVECMFSVLPALSGQTLYPSVQLYSKGSGLARGAMALLQNS